MHGSSLTECEAQGDGGAIFNSLGVLSVHASFLASNRAGKVCAPAARPTLNRTRPHYPSSRTAQDGGAIMNFKGTVEVFSCVIESNLAPGSGWVIYTNAEMLLQVVSPRHPRHPRHPRTPQSCTPCTTCS